MDTYNSDYNGFFRVSLTSIYDYIAWIFPPTLTLLSLTNILAVVVFIQPSMRRVHTNVYLAFLAVADFLYVNTSTWPNIQEIVQGMLLYIHLWYIPMPFYILCNYFCVLLIWDRKAYADMIIRCL